MKVLVLLIMAGYALNDPYDNPHKTIVASLICAIAFVFAIRADNRINDFKENIVKYLIWTQNYFTRMK